MVHLLTPDGSRNIAVVVAVLAFLGSLLTALCALLDRYPSDDINKFLWMVRIGGGVFPDIKEKDFLGEGGYRVDTKAGKVNCKATPVRTKSSESPLVWSSSARVNSGLAWQSKLGMDWATAQDMVLASTTSRS